MKSKNKRARGKGGEKVAADVTKGKDEDGRVGGGGGRSEGRAREKGPGLLRYLTAVIRAKKKKKKKETSLVVHKGAQAFRRDAQVNHISHALVVGALIISRAPSVFSPSLLLFALHMYRVGIRAKRKRTSVEKVSGRGRRGCEKERDRKEERKENGKREKAVASGW
ncbi:hypothetical protein PUN28_017334 [Cardiocondyla obscurior]|uniref:Uncharacterized protein n=1 Tax=Cardiocondyla obscurior TaxID=286306 RepID=A0AAW2EN09_9HYME